MTTVMSLNAERGFSVSVKLNAAVYGVRFLNLNRQSPGSVQRSVADKPFCDYSQDLQCKRYITIATSATNISFYTAVLHS
jgi:hypothetical protein